MSEHPQDELLTAALDGTLSAADREVVDAHLKVCAQCRGDLELARGARTALRSLPDEIRPPIDVAAAVATEIAGGGASAGAPTGPPRWYRAAGLVAAAAAIALGAMVLPRVIGGEQHDSHVTAAVGAGDTNSAPQEAGAGPTGTMAVKMTPALERSATDYDEARLRGLFAHTDLTSAPSATMDSAGPLAAPERGAIDCLRTAAGASTLDDAALVRLIDATFQGTPARIGVFSVPDGTGLVVAAARDDCRLLASVAS